MRGIVPAPRMRLRLHRCSDRAVAGAAVAGMRPTRRRCPAAAPRPCSRSSRWIPPTPAGPHVVPLLVTRPLATPLALGPLGTLRPLEDVPALLTRRLQRTRRPAHLSRPARVPARPHPQLQELTGNPGETGDLLRDAISQVSALHEHLTSVDTRSRRFTRSAAELAVPSHARRVAVREGVELPWL